VGRSRYNDGMQRSAAGGLRVLSCVMGGFLTGAALLVGFRPRVAAFVALLMVINFHFAMGLLFQLAYLTNGYGPPVVGSLAALALGPARLPFSVHR
jgi:hypothetical protein